MGMLLATEQMASATLWMHAGPASHGC